MSEQASLDRAYGSWTKGPGEENFPVASVLIDRDKRPVVAAYYAFARTADDIADDPALDEAAKIDGLESLRAGLHDADTAPAARLRALLTAKAIPLAVAEDLLTAFLRDARGESCRTWDDLMAYCRYSAMPVGRFLLALHREDSASQAAADALCAALQVLNHLQDCKDDHILLDRCYIPTAWLAQEGLEPSILGATHGTPGLRRVLNRCLDGVERLLTQADALPDAVRNRGLRWQARVTLALAYRLLAKLRQDDPLAAPVKLSPWDWVAATGRSLRRGPVAAAPVSVETQDRLAVTALVTESGSSFAPAMRLLRPSRRHACYALYAFCRTVDDIADGPAPLEAKRARLLSWRGLLTGTLAQAPDDPVARSILRARDRFELPLDSLLAVVDGVLMDVGAPLQAPAPGLYKLYVNRVAGAVGVLILAILGQRGQAARNLALTLGEAMQTTNILRDIAEDSSMGRLYVPQDVLEAEGILSTDPAAVVQNPALPSVRRSLARRARAGFLQARDDLAALPKRPLMVALMLVAYENLLQRLEQQGWDNLTRPKSPNSLTRVMLLLKAMGLSRFRAG